MQLICFLHKTYAVSAVSVGLSLASVPGVLLLHPAPRQCRNDPFCEVRVRFRNLYRLVFFEKEFVESQLDGLANLESVLVNFLFRHLRHIFWQVFHFLLQLFQLLKLVPIVQLFFQDQFLVLLVLLKTQPFQ